jgi:hypothetical protein
MIFFALTRSGYDELVRSFGRAPSPLWVNSGILSESDAADIRASGAELTEFTSQVAVNSASIETALDTIKQHHPSCSIWVEHPRQP